MEKISRERERERGRDSPFREKEKKIVGIDKYLSTTTKEYIL